MKQTKKIAILGAGLAGVTTAIGLVKLGFNVTTYYKNRVFIAYEGFSEKTKDGLLSFSCTESAKLLENRSLRNSNWATDSTSANYEYVVCRKDLDEALLIDAKKQNIKCIEATIIGSVEYENSKATVFYKKNGSKVFTEYDFIVDARGRFTPFKNEYISGPRSFSLLQELEMENEQENKTSIHSSKDGWIWQAYVGNKRGYIQFSCDEELSQNIGDFDDLLKVLKDQDKELWSLNNSKPVGNMIKRDAYSKIHKEIVNNTMILVGDSASSIDPLSGNGAFQAMSMSSVAPYVINTILNKSQKEQKVAMEFYRNRVKFIFDKFSKVGKEFYLLETRYKASFWDKRQNWPKIETNETSSNKVRIEPRAVVTESFIVAQDVVITQQNPMGVWCYGNIEVVELSRYCLENNSSKSLAYFDTFCIKNKLPEKVIYQLKNWLLSQSILKS